MPSFKIDTSTAVVFVATAPVPKLANAKTGERALDRETWAARSVPPPASRFCASSVTRSTGLCATSW